METSTPLEQFPHKRRAFVIRVKTGCITCKIRKIRCDEERPACRRCTSTGRKCDGYQSGKDTNRHTTSSSNHRFSTTPAEEFNSLTILQPGHPLPRKDDQELRSFRFFLHVSAPAIANVFDAEFWLIEIPRACHTDTAIWHAVVCLGAVHENCIRTNNYTADGPASIFTLRQFNAAIGYLVRSSAPQTIMNDRWRALLVSVLFAYQCSFQGLYSQSNIHLNAAKELMKELEGAKQQSTRFGNPQRAFSKTASKDLTWPVTNSVPYESLLSVVASLETHTLALQSTDAYDASVLFGGVDAYTSWRYYSAPAMGKLSDSCRHGRCAPSRATPANLSRAGRAIKSLLNGLLLLSQQNSGDVARLILGGEHHLLATLKHRQEPYARAFRELDIAIKGFIADTTAECSCLRPLGQGFSAPQQKMAINALRLYHSTCYPVFLDKSAISSIGPELCHPLLNREPVDYMHAHSDNHGTASIRLTGPDEALTEHFTRTLDLAESLLGQHATPRGSVEASSFIPTLPTTLPLFILAHLSGIGHASRQRIIAMLRQFPKREVLWDSSLAAALIELTMSVESQGSGLENASVSPSTLVNKVYGLAMKFTEERNYTARVVVRTWKDWIDKRPGQERFMRWSTSG